MKFQNIHNFFWKEGGGGARGMGLGPIAKYISALDYLQYAIKNLL